MVVSPKDRTTSSSVGAKSSRVVDWMRSTVGQSMTNVDSSPTAVLMSTDVELWTLWWSEATARMLEDGPSPTAVLMSTDVELWWSEATAGKLEDGPSPTAVAVLMSAAGGVDVSLTSPGA